MPEKFSYGISYMSEGGFRITRVFDDAASCAEVLSYMDKWHPERILSVKRPGRPTWRAIHNKNTVFPLSMAWGE